MSISDSDQFVPVEPEVTINAPEPEDDSDDGQESTFQPKQQGQAAQAPRQPGDKQRATGDNRKGRREAFSRATEQLEQKLQASQQRQFDEMKTFFAQQLAAANQAAGVRQAPAAAPGPDPTQQRIAEVAASMQSELAAFRAHDPSKGQYDLKRYYDLKANHDALAARAGTIQTLQEMGLTPQMLQQMRQGPPAPPTAAEVQMNYRYNQLKEAFPWMEDRAADGTWANATAVGRYRDYLHSVGRPDNSDTDREAALHVQNERGLRGRQAPPRGNPAPFMNPMGGDVGGGSAPRAMKLPAAVLRGLNPRELAHMKNSLFSDDEG